MGGGGGGGPVRMTVLFAKKSKHSSANRSPRILEGLAIYVKRYASRLTAYSFHNTAIQSQSTTYLYTLSSLVHLPQIYFD